MRTMTKILCVAGCAIYFAIPSSYAEQQESEELQILRAKLAIAQAEARKAEAEAEKAKADAKKNRTSAKAESAPDFLVKFEGVAEKTPPDEIDWKERAKLGDTGNVTVYVENDMPTEVYVIGVAAIPTTMGTVRAEQFAHRQAEMKAKASFALWMKEHFSVSFGTTNKTLVITTGDSGTPDGIREKSEDRMMTTENATQFATATWRGMRVVKVFQDAEKSQRVEVWRWSVQEHQLARIVEMLTRDGDPELIRRKQYMKIESFEISR